MITNAGSLERYKTTCNAAHAIAAHPHSSTEACSRNASPVSALPRDFLEFFDLRRRARRTGCAIEIEDVDPSAGQTSLTRTSGSRYGPARASRFPASGRSARLRRCRRVKFFRGTGSNGIINPTFTVENTSPPSANVESSIYENTTLVRRPKIASLVLSVLQETFRFAGRPGSLPAGASRARSTLCALARAPRSSRSVQRTVVSVREQSPAGPRGVRVGGVTRRCCFLGGRAKPPPRGSADAPAEPTRA